MWKTHLFIKKGVFHRFKGVIGFVHVTPFYDVCLAANDVTSQPLVMMYHLKVK